VHSIPPSRDGVTKATKFFHVSHDSGAHEEFPALVVSIRGTLPKRAIDWAVNFNHKLRKPGDVLESVVINNKYLNISTYQLINELER
jgi:hypothetical protein